MNSHMNTLFDDFIHDAGLSICRKILDAVNSRMPERVISEFNSNCFDVTLNYVERFALLEDVLDISPSREQRYPLEEFTMLLTQAEANLRAQEQN